MEKFLIDFINCNVFSRNGDFCRIPCIFPGKILYIGIQSRAEEHRLSLLTCRQNLDKGTKVRVEPHIKHAVCLVDYKEPNVSKIHLSALVEVYYTTRCSDENINTLLEGGDLLVVTYTTIEACALQRTSAAKLFSFFLNLNRKFTCWNHNKGLPALNICS